MLAAAIETARSLTPTDPLIAWLTTAISPREIRQTIARYSGAAPLGDTRSEPVASRHAAHRDNERVVGQLLHDFGAIRGVAVRPLRFWLDAIGGYRSNVEARLRTIHPPEAVVLITAHIDSTAKFESGYDPAVSSAPGADDNASGMAALLAIARAASRIAQVSSSKCELRFVLFNAEESGLAGSRRYADTWHSHGPPVIGVMQLDMIGHRSRRLPDGSHPFEIHAGGARLPATMAWSRAIADVVATLTPKVTPELAPHVYPGELNVDPGSGRSDHSSFHRKNIGAVVISEHIHRGPNRTSPLPSPNAGYHRYSDTIDAIDATYAAAIARVTATAAVVIATAYDSIRGRASGTRAEPVQG